MANSRRKAGFTLIEGLLAGAIMVIAIVGMFGSWNGLLNRSSDSKQATLAGQLSRAEIERAKVYGIANLPLGTYSATTKTATWTGDFDPTANSGAGGWVSGGTAYYDKNGARLASSTGAYESIQDSMIDSNVDVSGTSYTFELTSEKAMTVTVKLISNSSTLMTAGTNIVTGGL